MQSPGDDGLVLQAEDDSLLKNKSSSAGIDVLANDVIHLTENFNHSTQISASGNSGVLVPLLNSPPDQDSFFYWFQALSGTSRFTTLDTGAVSEVEFDGFQFGASLTIVPEDPENCPEDAMAWASWGGGVLTITNDFGVTEFTNVTFIGGVVIDYKAQYGYLGQARGSFQSELGELVFVLPEFDGRVQSQTVEGDGLLEFTRAPRLTITSPPGEGTATVVTDDGASLPTVAYEPNANATGVDSFEYQIMTQLGDTSAAQVEIGTMDLDISNLEGGELSEITEDNPGLFLPVNNDDDNRNGVSDLLEVGFTDNDLARLEIKELAPPGLDPLSGYFTLSFDPARVRIWHNDDKTLPDNHQSAQVISARDDSQPTRFIIDDPLEDFEVWVEGVAWGSTTIDLTWHGTGGNAVYDSVTVWVVGMDLDIDSDNNGTIEGSAWEEELESHEFALGKLIYNQPPPTPPQDQVPVPVLLRLPPGLPPTMRIHFWSIRQEGRNTGQLELLDHLQRYLRAFAFGESIETYTLQSLGYSQGTGEVQLFLRAKAYNGIKNKKEADAEGKPDNRFAARLILPGQSSPVVSDAVKVLIVRDLDFFDSVQTFPQLRSAGGAEAVYSPPGNAPIISLTDAKIFTLRYIDRDEMEEILARDTISGAVSEAERSQVIGTIRSYLYNFRPNPFPGKDTSFQAGLYRDYVTGDYKLAMRGTEPGQGWQTATDWFTNLQQLIDGNSASYENGIFLTWALLKLDEIQAQTLRLTGHSLGGGIASAAAVANLTGADVFNAAGVNPESLLQEDGTPLIPGTNPGSVNYSDYVSNYVVWFARDVYLNSYDVPDFLTFLSSYIGWVPSPPGRLVELEGLENFSPSRLPAYQIAIGLLQALPVPPKGLIATPAYLVLVSTIISKLSTKLITQMVNSHGFESIYFGILHDDAIGTNGWNAYDSLPPKNR